MGKVTKRTFSLPDEQAAYIDAKVDDGAYASASEVVRAGLRALQERDAMFEQWLREEAVPVYDAMKANPDRGSPARTVFADVRARYASREVRHGNVPMQTLKAKVDEAWDDPTPSHPAADAFGQIEKFHAEGVVRSLNRRG